MYFEAFGSPRRTVIVGAGLGAVTAVLAGCTTYGKKPAADKASSAPPQESGSSATPSGPTQLAQKTDVPVGSGVIVDDIVITQPTAGTFTGLSSVCTHAGCNVSEVVDGALRGDLQIVVVGDILGPCRRGSGGPDHTAPVKGRWPQGVASYF